MASATMELLPLARAQAREIERVVSRSGPFSARLWRLAVDAAFAPDKPFEEARVNGLIEELTDLMAYSYLLKLKSAARQRKIAKRVRATLSLASSVLDSAKEIAKLFDLDLGNIKERFEPVSKKAIKKTLKDIRDVVHKALAKASQVGVSTQDSTAFVLQALRKHGIQPRTNSYVEALIRTHSAIAYGIAQKQSYQNDLDLWGFEYMTMGDDRVRPEHEELEGVRRKKDDAFWDTFWPPNGWNCRCQVVPIYDQATRQTPVPAGAQPDEGFDTDFLFLLDK